MTTQKLKPFDLQKSNQFSEQPCCKFKGEWKREVKKPGVFIRIVQAIKRAWGCTE